MLTTLALISAISFVQKTPVQCPIMTGAANFKGSTTTYKGVQFGYCCGGCEAAFMKDPEKALKAAAGRTVGVSLFDPVSKARILEKDAAGGSSDFNSVRYFFATKEEKAQFDKAPKSFTNAPAKEAVYCPVANKAIDGGVMKAGAFADVGGVRYYFCCTNCQAKFNADPSKFIPNSASHVEAAKAEKVPAN